jgi:Glycosyl hydrolases family 16
MWSTHRKFPSSACRSFLVIVSALLVSTSVLQPPSAAPIPRALRTRHGCCAWCPTLTGSCLQRVSPPASPRRAAPATSSPPSWTPSRAPRPPKLQQQAAVAATPSGEAMPVGDIPRWHQIFTDDFTTTVPIGSFPGAVASKWFAYPDGWKDTSKKGAYSPSKVVSEHDGIMDLFLHTEDGVHMVSAPVPKLAAGAHDYGSGLSAGRYVVRFKADPIPCYKTAWLLWPDSEVWPRDGEIDFPEADLDGTISGFMHRRNGTSGNDQDVYDTAFTYSSWHTAVIEWRPDINDLKFYLDGKPVGHSTLRVPNTPMHWVLQTETRLLGCVPTKSAAGHVLIDWVAVYTPTANTAAIAPATARR